MLLALGCMDLDLALRIDEPETPTEQSTQAKLCIIRAMGEIQSSQYDGDQDPHQPEHKGIYP